MTVPEAVEELTPGWLSSVLGAPVHGVEVLDAHSGTTGRVRVALDAGPSLPASVFVKLAPFDDRQRRFVDATGLGVAEARFYRDVAAGLPVRVPRVWRALVEERGYIMVLEDLVATGARFPRPDDADLAGLVDRIVDELAALHLAYWESPALEDELAFVGGGGRLAFGAGGSFVGRAVERFAAEMGPGFRAVGERYARRAPEIATLWDREPRTLAHGDPHLGNLFVDGDRPGFFDWGMVMRRAGMWDIAYVLCGSVPTEVRREHERGWLRRYRDRLAAGGVVVDDADLWDQYRLFSVYAWVSATSTAGVGERFQRSQVALPAMARATVAVEDLDAVGYLDAVLSGRRP